MKGGRRQKVFGAKKASRSVIGGKSAQRLESFAAQRTIHWHGLATHTADYLSILTTQHSVVQEHEQI